MRLMLRQSLIALALGTLLAPALAKGPAPSTTAEAWRTDVAALGADEIPSILQVFAGGKPAQMPKVIQVIHTPDDTLAQVDAAAAARGIDAVEAALRAWDATQGH